MSTRQTNIDLFNYKRRATVAVKVGALMMGSDYPVRVQSMTNTSTMDTEGSVAQIARIVERGGELVRLTTQGSREAVNMGAIKEGAAKAGCNVPLVADVHFNASVADVAAQYADKVRVLALKMGVPADRKARVVEALRANIAEVNDHLDTGIVGTRYLFEVLCDNGLKELAYKIINQRDFPGFGWWIEQGATTTWEQWDGGNSRNHPMFGGGIGWFYRDLAGVRLKDAGFRSFDVKPVIPDGLEWVSYSLNTTYGKIAVDWTLRNGRFMLECEVPVGATATIWVPYGGDVPKIKESKFVKAKGLRDGYALYEVASGRYKFKSNM